MRGIKGRPTRNRLLSAPKVTALLIITVLGERPSSMCVKSGNEFSTHFTRVESVVSDSKRLLVVANRCEEIISGGEVSEAIRLSNLRAKEQEFYRVMLPLVKKDDQRDVLLSMPDVVHLLSLNIYTRMLPLPIRSALRADPQYGGRALTHLKKLHASLMDRVRLNCKRVLQSNRKAPYDADELDVGFHITISCKCELELRGQASFSKDALVVTAGASDSSVRVVFLKRHCWPRRFLTMARSQVCEGSLAAFKYAVEAEARMAAKLGPSGTVQTSVWRVFYKGDADLLDSKRHPSAIVHAVQPLPTASIVTRARQYVAEHAAGDRQDYNFNWPAHQPSHDKWFVLWCMTELMDGQETGMTTLGLVSVAEAVAGGVDGLVINQLTAESLRLSVEANVKSAGDMARLLTKGGGTPQLKNLVKEAGEPIVTRSGLFNVDAIQQVSARVGDNGMPFSSFLEGSAQATTVQQATLILAHAPIAETLTCAVDLYKDKRNAKHHLMRNGSGFVGSQLGAAIGTAAIPIPVLGTVIGGGIGAWVGQAFGSEMVPPRNGRQKHFF